MDTLKQLSLLISFLVFSVFVQAQKTPAENKKALQAAEDSLVKLRAGIVSAGSDSIMSSTNRLFVEHLEKTLKINGSFHYPFERLEAIANLRSDDGAIRILNWNIPKSDGTQEYFGFVQVYDKKEDQVVLHQLIDQSHKISSPERKTLDPEAWYGALYYEIITVKKRRKKTYYTLLGWDGNNRLTTKKIIDALYISGNDRIKFGMPVYKLGKLAKKRVIFEYASEAAMSVRYDQKKKRIIFDHLSPSEPQYEGQLQYYGPDLSYDALKMKKGKWLYEKDVDARMEKKR